MNEETSIIFQGAGPFCLPIVQHASADGNKNNGVAIILSAILPNRGPHSKLGLSCSLLPLATQP